MSAVVTLVLLGLLNGAMFAGEVVVYGTWWADGQPVGLYINPTGDRPQLQPGAQLDGAWYQIGINSLGFRGPEVQEPRPRNAFRVWCVGGSTTFDIYAPDNAHTWPALLQERLQEGLPDRSVEVINTGIPGEVMSGSVKDFQDLAGQLKPDLVVVYHGPNDLRRVLDNTAQTIGPSGGDSRLDGLLRADVALLRVLKRRLQSSPYMLTQRPDRALSAETMTPILNDLEQLLRQVESRKAVAVMATHALRAAPDTRGEPARREVAETAMMLQMSAESAIEAFALYNEMVADLAASRGLVLADVRASVPPDPALWGDGTHFAAGGSVLAADAIAEAILGSSLANADRDRR